MPPDSKKAFSDFVDKLPRAICEWYNTCDKLGSTTLEDCATELAAELDIESMAACDAAAQFYASNREALDACLEGNTGPCGSDDIGDFCPTMKEFNFEVACKTPAADGGVQPTTDCIETTFQVTNWPGTPTNNALYTGTSWELEKCTEIQPDYLTITIKCQKDSYGNARLISEGCGVLGIAAPGNILNDVGAPPSSGKTACAGRTVSNETITCYQSCNKELEFKITSGPCS